MLRWCLFGLLCCVGVFSSCAYRANIEGDDTKVPLPKETDLTKLPLPKDLSIPMVPKGSKDVNDTCKRRGALIVCTLEGTYKGTQVLTSDRVWLLRGLVHVGEDKNFVTEPQIPELSGVLVIEPGTTIWGEKSSNGRLVIHGNSRIYAVGQPKKPIVFTSSMEEGKRKAGDWGGLYLSGLATISDCGSGQDTCQSISPQGFYGGPNDDDDSGLLQYVRIEFAGRPATEFSKHNGLVLQGVGRKTRVSHVQIHQSLQSGLTLLGGTVNWKYVLSTGVGRSHLYWRFGWRGKGQFFVAQSMANNESIGINGQNNPGLLNEAPRSQPTLSNVTLLGGRSTKSKQGVLLHQGTAGHLANMVAAGWSQSCVMLDQIETLQHAWAQNNLSGTLTLSHSVFFCNKTTAEPELLGGETAPFSVKDFVERLNPGNSLKAPKFSKATEEGKEAWKPLPDSPLQGGAVWKGPHADDFFQKVSFVGAVGTEDWTKGWTTNRVR